MSIILERKRTPEQERQLDRRAKRFNPKKDDAQPDVNTFDERQLRLAKRAATVSGQKQLAKECGERLIELHAPRDQRSMHLGREAQNRLNGRVKHCVPDSCVICCEFVSSLDSLTGNLGEATIHRLT